MAVRDVQEGQLLFVKGELLVQKFHLAEHHVTPALFEVRLFLPSRPVRSEQALNDLARLGEKGDEFFKISIVLKKS